MAIANLKNINKELYTYYKSKAKSLTKQVLTGEASALDEFIFQLTALRDQFILTVDEKNEAATTALKMLANAINEYKLYNTCILNYYKIENNIAVQLDEKKTAEAVTEEYNDERAKHWTTFWKLVMVGMEDWQRYATI